MRSKASALLGMAKTYLTTCGAMTLHGPHQVAKQSRTMRPFSPRAESKSALEVRLWTPDLAIVTVVAEKKRVGCCCRLTVNRGVLVVVVVKLAGLRKGARLVSSVRLSADEEDAARDMQ